MPRPIATDALFVRISDYAETSAVVTLLTADLGTIGAVAKGAKRMKNSFQGPVDRGRIYRVRVKRRGQDGLFHLHGAAVREALPRLRHDAGRFLAASLVLEVAADLVRDEEPHPELFRLAVFTLKVLDRAPPSRIAVAVPFFLVRALESSGHAPELSRCVATGRPLSRKKPALIHPGRGGLLDEDAAREEPGVRAVTWALVDLYRSVRDARPHDALRLDAPAADWHELRRLCVDWLEYVLERRFRAALARVPGGG